MPAAKKSVRLAVARAGAAKRWGRDDEPARKDLKEERLRAYIERVLDEAPPLSEAQLRRLGTLFEAGVQVPEVSRETTPAPARAREGSRG